MNFEEYFINKEQKMVQCAIKKISEEKSYWCGECHWGCAVMKASTFINKRNRLIALVMQKSY